jgi:hypothetical protein
MEIDGNIHSRFGSLVFLLALASWAVLTALLFGTVFKHEHLRDPSRSLFLGPWEILNERTWTPEGLEFQRRYIRFAIKSIFILVCLFVALDALF